MSPNNPTSKVRVPRTPLGSAPSRQVGKSRSSAGRDPSRKRRGQALFLTGIGIKSIFRVSVLFYTFILAVFLVAGFILWMILGISGYETKLNNLIDSLIGSSTYHLIGLDVFIVTTAIGVVWVVVSATLTTIAVKMFNLVADLVGGIRIYLDQAAQKDI